MSRTPSSSTASSSNLRCRPSSRMGSMADPKWLAEKEVSELIDLSAAIDAVEAGLRLEAAGPGATMAKTDVAGGGGQTLHALGAALPGRNMVGTKTWAHTEGGATPLL